MPFWSLKLFLRRNRKDSAKIEDAKRKTMDYSFSDWKSSDKAKEIASRLDVLGEEEGPAEEATRRRILPTEET